LARLNKDRSLLLDKLIGDCVAYNLTLAESMEYIKREYPYGQIKERVFFRRKRKLNSEETAMSWLSEFGRVGFVQLHKKITNDIRVQIDDSLHRLYEEKQKPAKERDDHLILKIKKHINESSDLLANLAAGSPVIAGLKAKIDKYQNGDSARTVEDYYNKDYWH